VTRKKSFVTLTTRSYEGLGDANKLKPLEVELKRLEDLSESIVQVITHQGPVL